MQQSLISIVFPMYNVERFVKKSLESIVNQSYENIEIIIVNDGSTDEGVRICRDFAIKDPRIILIEQENQGLSAARNTGLNRAKGAYVMFVDSDDWIHRDMITILYQDLVANDVEVAMCGYKKVREGDSGVSIIENKNLEVISSKEAIQRMLLGEWWSACMKLYHYSVFKNLRFPVGRNNEDYAILVQVFEQCKQISYNPTALYNYLTREDSITTKPLNERSFDEVVNGKEVLEYVKEKFPQFSKEAERNLGASLIKLIMQIDLDQSGNYRDKQLELLDLLNNHYSSFVKNPFIPKRQKVFLFVMCYFNSYFRKLFLKIYQSYNSF